MSYLCTLCGPGRCVCHRHLQNEGVSLSKWRETSGPGEGKDVLSESERRKRTPVYSGVMMYFPDAMQAIARVSWKGNAKHNGPDTPLQWTRGKSNDHADCVARHMLTPDEIDPDSDETHLAHAAWRILALLQLQQEKLKENK